MVTAEWPLSFTVTVRVKTAAWAAVLWRVTVITGQPNSKVRINPECQPDLVIPKEEKRIGGVYFQELSDQLNIFKLFKIRAQKQIVFRAKWALEKF